MHAEVVAGTSPDTVLLLEHPPVYTAGKRTELASSARSTARRSSTSTAAARSPGTGPGSSSATRSCGCPTRSTSSPTSAGSRRLLIDVCADLGVATARVEGRSGVWVPADDRGPDRKVAAIGVRVARGVTMHGFALNCDCDLTRFDRDRAVRDRRRRRHLAQPPSSAATSRSPSSPSSTSPRRRRSALVATGRTACAAADVRVGRVVTDRPGGPQAAAPRGPQRRDADRAQARRGSRRGRGWARSTRELQGAGAGARACTRCARRPAAPTSTSAGRTARPPSSSAATSAPGAATSARSTPASPQPLDRDEPRRVAESVAAMGLRYATVTGVARDDLPDGGAWLYAETVRADPRAQPRHRRRAADPRLQRRARPARRGVRRRARGARAQRRDGAADLQADPARRSATSAPSTCITPGPRRRAGHQVQPHPRHGRGAATRSSQALRDLHDAGCELITITQYLRPSPRHHPVERWVTPGGVRRAARRGRADRLRRRDERPAGPLVLPRRPALPAGDRGPRGRRPA